MLRKQTGWMQLPALRPRTSGALWQPATRVLTCLGHPAGTGLEAQCRLD